ncbi:hypothetical protein [Thioalkalivibrio sp. ALE20]|uniref:hypothetical protein n=1 Tax=Thioalkalivibrio sp. ALE20 TaxID=545275 RepID=UPI00037FB192|nr:hypothetical protein [Thioalkalivibrio sp. ALE20]
MVAVAPITPNPLDDLTQQERLVRLWCLRILHDLQLHTRLRWSEVTPSLMTACGLEGEGLEYGPDAQGEGIAETERRIQDLLNQGVQSAFPEPLGSNLDQLGERLELGRVETRVLGFLALMHLHADLFESLDAYLDRRSELLSKVVYGGIEEGGVSGWNGSASNQPAKGDTPPWLTIRQTSRTDQRTR